MVDLRPVITELKFRVLQIERAIRAMEELQERHPENYKQAVTPPQAGANEGMMVCHAGDRNGAALAESARRAAGVPRNSVTIGRTRRESANRPAPVTTDGKRGCQCKPSQTIRRLTGKP